MSDLGAATATATATATARPRVRASRRRADFFRLRRRRLNRRDAAVQA
jgi:hypothetical protein